jgi:Cd2+/Zn2+-exporting ATPase
VLRIDGMDCPTEEAMIRGKLSDFPGVTGLAFNLLERRLTLSHTPGTLPGAMDALRGLGFDPVPQSAAGSAKPELQPPAVNRRELALLGVAGLCAVAAEIVDWTGGPLWLEIALSLVAVFSGGLDTYKKGWIALKNRTLNINALMSVAVTGAMVIGQWPEAAMVMVLFAIAELIEKVSLERARNAVRGLMAMTPETASVRQPDNSWREVAAIEVAVGAVMRVRPGDRVALDGVVIQGQSSVNQAPITGESIPVEKAVGDAVYAGSINEVGALEVRVTAASTDSTVARIIHAVEAAQGSRAPTQRFVDQFARIYTPVVFAAAIAVALLPPLFFGGMWLTWIYRALVLLVIACPCALVISTPVTIVSGLAAAARRGILIKGGVFLEAGRTLKVMALDKTGTLTLGKPAVVDFLPFADRAATLRLAASLASHSDHPVSQAITRYADGHTQLADPVAMQALPGRGVKAEIEGQLLYLGNHRLVEELKICSPALEAQLKALESQGKTTTLLMSESQVLGVFGVADTVRESSKEAVVALHALGITTAMLTGDNPLTAKAIASQVGIDIVQAELLPADKLAAIEALAAKHGAVGMVGDGINDAPALARADIGFAMGAAGSDTALETADVALMDDDPRKLAEFIRLSRRTAAILRQNIVLALGIKAVFLVLAVLGSATLWMAVFADMGASLLVVANGLRLLRQGQSR